MEARRFPTTLRHEFALAGSHPQLALGKRLARSWIMHLMSSNKVILRRREEARDRRGSTGESPHLAAIPTVTEVVLVGRATDVATRVANVLAVNVPDHRRPVRVRRAVRTGNYGSALWRASGPARFRLGAAYRHDRTRTRGGRQGNTVLCAVNAYPRLCTKAAAQDSKYRRQFTKQA